MSTILASTSQAAAATTTTSSFPFNAGAIVTATCANSSTPPVTGCQVQLQLSVDNSNWVNIDKRFFGVGPSATYYEAFDLSNYAGPGVTSGLPGTENTLGWLYYRLVFSNNPDQSVTIAAVDNSPIEVAIIPLTGVAATTGGAIAAWVPPQGGPIFITDIIVYSTANSTGSATLGVGVAANKTTASLAMINASQLNASLNTIIVSGTGTSAVAQSILTGSCALTFTGNANSTGYNGTAYVTYLKP